MGRIRFLVPDKRLLPDEVLPRIYTSGIEDIPWPTRAHWEENLLVVERGVNESCNVHVPWRPNGVAEQILSTASLMERDRPYLLDVELARGALSQIRTHRNVWQAAGLIISSDIAQQIAQATDLFSRTVPLQQQADEAGRRAGQVLTLCHRIARSLGDSYAQQAIALRRQETPSLPVLLGINLESMSPRIRLKTPLESVFHMGAVPMVWRYLETHQGSYDWQPVDRQVLACQLRNLKVFGGPLLRLDAGGIPDWLILWDDDYENLVSLILDHVSNVVTRYRGRVHLWQVASRLNLPSALSLTEQQACELLVRVTETTRKLDPQTPQVVLFDQPWGESANRHDADRMPALQLADALTRSNLGISGFGLEINAGYYPGGTTHRNLLALSRKLDHWSLLGTPLMVAITTPSHGSQGRQTVRVHGPGDELHTTNQACDGHTEQTQREWIANYVPMILAKSFVQVIVWNQLCDRELDDYPYGGLCHATGLEKPAFDALRAIRQHYLA